MLITEYLAVYAAVLSTTTLAWNIFSARPSIKVEIVPGLEGSGDAAQFGYFISVKNPSGHTVHINSVQLLYPYLVVTWLDKLKHVAKFRTFGPYIGWVHNGMVFDGLDTGLPKSLEPRTSHSIFISESRVSSMLRGDNADRFAAVAQDALWRNKYSKPYSIGPRRKVKPGSLLK